MRQWLMEYKVTGLIPILTFNYRSGTCVNVSSPSTLIQLEIPNGTSYLHWGSETVWVKEGDTNLTHKFTCLCLSCVSSDLNAPLLVCQEGNNHKIQHLFSGVTCLSFSKSGQFVLSKLDENTVFEGLLKEILIKYLVPTSLLVTHLKKIEITIYNHCFYKYF